MSIKLLSNLDYPIGNIINQELQNANNVQIAVAFLRHAGIKFIESSLRHCLDRGGSVELIVGLDFRTTDAQSMRYFINLKNKYSKAKFYCFGDKEENKTKIVFHPKIYLFENGQETTGIVGSTNLTKGGLTLNFEVNTIFKETKPVYFSQLQAIYNSIKYTDSVFSPDEEYLSKYSRAHDEFSRKADMASHDKDVQQVVTELRHREELLPGTVPSLKSLVISAIKKKRSDKQQFVALPDLYEEVEKVVVANRNLPFKMETLRNSIRGELNRHEENSKLPESMRLFVRSPQERGFYSLTTAGENYNGR